MCQQYERGEELPGPHPATRELFVVGKRSHYSRSSARVNGILHWAPVEACCVAQRDARV
jgi:hypothetical protein